MFRIGDFAKMARISIKTLHHYDEIDLFKPELVHAATSYRSYRIDIEMAVEVEGSLLTKTAHFPSDHVRVWELPGTPTMAYLLLSGSYDRLWDAHIRLMTWIEDHGYRSAGSPRCIYLRRPSLHGEPLTELQIPIEPGH